MFYAVVGNRNKRFSFSCRAKTLAAIKEYANSLGYGTEMIELHYRDVRVTKSGVVVEALFPDKGGQNDKT